MIGIVRAGSLACKADGSQAYHSMWEKAAETTRLAHAGPVLWPEGGQDPAFSQDTRIYLSPIQC